MISWDMVRQVLSDNKIEVDAYTLSAYIALFGDSDYWGNREIKEINEWLTSNFDCFDEKLKRLVIDSFLEKDGFSWLNSYCNDGRKRELGLKKVRFAAITDTVLSLTDDMLENYIELSNCFCLFCEKMKQPTFLYEAYTEEEISKAIQSIKKWLEEEKSSIMNT